MTPISILDLEKPFYGGETAYLLVYRSRSLDQEIVQPAAAASSLSMLPNSTVVGKDLGGMVAGGWAGGGGARALPGGLQMTSVPPPYWMDKVDDENVSFKTVKDNR